MPLARLAVAQPTRRILLAGLATTLAGQRRGSADIISPVVVVAGPRPGHLTVINNAHAAVRLRPAVNVEGFDGQVWKPVSTEMNLVRECIEPSAPSPACVTLEGGQRLTPPPWRGWSCNGQCNMHCRANLYWGTGPFRFWVVECDTGAAFRSDPFAMPGVPTRPTDDL